MKLLRTMWRAPQLAALGKGFADGLPAGRTIEELTAATEINREPVTRFPAQWNSFPALG